MESSQKRRWEREQSYGGGGGPLISCDLMPLKYTHTTIESPWPAKWFIQLSSALRSCHIDHALNICPSQWSLVARKRGSLESVHQKKGYYCKDT